MDVDDSRKREIRRFHGLTAVVSRPIITPAIILICIAIFAAMVAAGASAFGPANSVLIDWGGNFAPLVVLDHQLWRLFTSVFLHSGIFHILINMYCLLAIGPLVERWYGHFAFACLYVLSGVGGEVATLLWVQPMSVSVGASGAIFGVFGGLLGHLAIRRHEVPVAMLRRLRTGALSIVVFSTLFSLSASGINTAAHLGGLATGLASGLLMTAVAHPRVSHRRGLGLAVRLILIVILLASGLAAIGRVGIDLVRGRILADPKIGLQLQRLSRPVVRVGR